MKQLLFPSGLFLTKARFYFIWGLHSTPAPHRNNTGFWSCHLWNRYVGRRINVEAISGNRIPPVSVDEYVEAAAPVILIIIIYFGSPACKVCFAGRISYNNLYTGRISLYKRIRWGCCSGYFNNNNIPARHRIKNSVLCFWVEKKEFWLFSKTVSAWTRTRDLKYYTTCTTRSIRCLTDAVQFDSIYKYINTRFNTKAVLCQSAPLLANLLGQ